VEVEFVVDVDVKNVAVAVLYIGNFIVLTIKEQH
jgi:hypothetical protein